MRSEEERGQGDGFEDDAGDLARHYARFRVAERVLLTGHSHQAWPDVAFAAQQQAWHDAAAWVDDKWERAFAMADRVRAGYRRLLDDREGHIALGQNTHELLIRFLSALPLGKRPRLVTTDGEFHTIRRQLDCLETAGIEVVRVETGQAGEAAAPDARQGDDPVATLAERIVAAVDDRTAAVLVSSVLYRDARIVEGLGEVAAVCARVGAELLVDAYHSLNAVPFSVTVLGLENAYVIGGGYKYCQLGEGNCFLRFPRDCGLRPVLTGWFSEFGTLATTSTERSGDRARAFPYGEGHLRFAGSTYDPVSHYRAAAVFDFFRRHDLHPLRLREIGLAQLRRLTAGIDALDQDPALLRRDHGVPLEERGGFLPLWTPHAEEICTALRARDIFADSRGRVLRLGPAPYLTTRQLDEAVAALGRVTGKLSGGRA